MRRQPNTYRLNARLARATWGELSRTAVRGLRNLTEEYDLSVAAGDLQFLEGRWYVTHAGLLRIAQRKHCCGIKSALVERLSDPLAGRWIFRLPFTSLHDPEASLASETPIHQMCPLSSAAAR
jgi:hypothetical protein